MKPLRSGNHYLHRESDYYRGKVHTKTDAYHVFMQTGIIAQGQLHYLSVEFPKLVWESFAPGSEPFVQAFHHRNLSLVT